MVWSERRRESEKKRDGANDKIMLFNAFHGCLFINHVLFFPVLAAGVLASDFVHDHGTVRV